MSGSLQLPKNQDPQKFYCVGLEPNSGYSIAIQDTGNHWQLTFAPGSEWIADASGLLKFSLEDLGIGGNLRPIAQAGPDQTVTDTDNSGSENVTLDGSGSSDSDGTIVVYDWRKNDMPIASGVNPSVNLAVGVHTLTLSVIDDNRAIANDTVVITVNAGNLPPVAQAGPDQATVNGSLVTLDGTASFDPNDDPLTYSWAQISGPAVTLSNPTTSSPSFTPPPNANLSFELTVTANGQISKDSVNIVSAEAPSIPTDGLNHAWLFEETSGSTVVNSVDAQYNGTLPPSPIYPHTHRRRENKQRLKLRWSQ